MAPFSLSITRSFQLLRSPGEPTDHQRKERGEFRRKLVPIGSPRERRRLICPLWSATECVASPQVNRGCDDSGKRSGHAIAPFALAAGERGIMAMRSPREKHLVECPAHQWLCANCSDGPGSGGLDDAPPNCRVRQ